jgi:hypothetical protein
MKLSSMASDASVCEVFYTSSISVWFEISELVVQASEIEKPRTSFFPVEREKAFDSPVEIPKKCSRETTCIHSHPFLLIRV